MCKCIKKIDYYDIDVAVKETSAIRAMCNLIFDGNNYDSNLESFYKKVSKIDNNRYKNYKEYYELGEDISNCVLEAGENVLYGMIDPYSRGDYFQRAYDKSIEAVKMVNNISDDWLTQNEKDKYYKKLYDYSEKLRNFVNNPTSSRLKNEYMDGTEEITEIATSMMMISVDALKSVEEIVKSSEILYVYE